MVGLFFLRPNVGIGLAIWKSALEENKGGGHSRMTGAKGCKAPEGAREGERQGQRSRR